MSDITTTEPTVTEPVEAPETPVETETAPEVAEDETKAVEADDTKSGSEAAKYRRRLRDTEAERDTLTGKLTEAREALLEAKLGKGRVKAEALKAAGHDVDSLIANNGSIDDAKLQFAIKDTMVRFGIAPTLIIPGEGRSPESRGNTPSWSDALNPAK
jgi:hypothetical protein